VWGGGGCEGIVQTDLSLARQVSVLLMVNEGRRSPPKRLFWVGTWVDWGSAGSLLLLFAHLLLRGVFEDVGIEAVHHVHRRIGAARLALEPNGLPLDFDHLQERKLPCHASLPLIPWGC